MSERRKLPIRWLTLAELVGEPNGSGDRLR
jgi:hypothetical protein